MPGKRDWETGEESLWGKKGETGQGGWVWGGVATRKKNWKNEDERKVQGGKGGAAIKGQFENGPRKTKRTKNLPRKSNPKEDSREDETWGRRKTSGGGEENVLEVGGRGNRMTKGVFLRLAIRVGKGRCDP